MLIHHLRNQAPDLRIWWTSQSDQDGQSDELFGHVVIEQESYRGSSGQRERVMITGNSYFITHHENRSRKSDVVNGPPHVHMTNVQNWNTRRYFTTRAGPHYRILGVTRRGLECANRIETRPVELPNLHTYSCYCR